MPKNYLVITPEDKIVMQYLGLRNPRDVIARFQKYGDECLASLYTRTIEALGHIADNSPYMA